MQALIPSHTPSGQPIPRRRGAVRSTSELLMLIAAGQVVHPTVETFGLHLGHPGVVYVPITDMEPLASALVWRRDDANPHVVAFDAHVARTLVTPPDSGPPPRRGRAAAPPEDRGRRAPRRRPG